MREHKLTNLLLAAIVALLIAGIVHGTGMFSRAVDRIEKAINQYASPNSDGSHQYTP